MKRLKHFVLFLAGCCAASLFTPVSVFSQIWTMEWQVPIEGKPVAWKDDGSRFVSLTGDNWFLLYDGITGEFIDSMGVFQTVESSLPAHSSPYTKYATGIYHEGSFITWQQPSRGNVQLVAYNEELSQFETVAEIDQEILRDRDHALGIMHGLLDDEILFTMGDILFESTSMMKYTGVFVKRDTALVFDRLVSQALVAMHVSPDGSHLTSVMWSSQYDPGDGTSGRQSMSQFGYAEGSEEILYSISYTASYSRGKSEGYIGQEWLPSNMSRLLTDGHELRVGSGEPFVPHGMPQGRYRPFKSNSQFISLTVSTPMGGEPFIVVHTYDVVKGAADTVVTLMPADVDAIDNGLAFPENSSALFLVHNNTVSRYEIPKGIVTQETDTVIINMPSSASIYDSVRVDIVPITTRTVSEVHVQFESGDVYIDGLHGFVVGKESGLQELTASVTFTDGSETVSSFSIDFTRPIGPDLLSMAGLDPVGTIDSWDDTLIVSIPKMSGKGRYRDTLVHGILSQIPAFYVDNFIHVEDSVVNVLGGRSGCLYLHSNCHKTIFYHADWCDRIWLDCSDLRQPVLLGSIYGSAEVVDQEKGTVWAEDHNHRIRRILFNQETGRYAVAVVAATGRDELITETTHYYGNRVFVLPTNPDTSVYQKSVAAGYSVDAGYGPYLVMSSIKTSDYGYNIRLLNLMTDEHDDITSFGVKDAILVSDDLIVSSKGTLERTDEGEWIERDTWPFSDVIDVVRMTENRTCLVRYRTDSVACVVDHYRGEIIEWLGDTHGIARTGCYNPDRRIVFVGSESGVVAGYDVTHAVSVNEPSPHRKGNDTRAWIANESLFIESTSSVDRVEVYSLLGSQLLIDTGQQHGGVCTYTVGHLPQGAYVVRWRSTDRWHSSMVSVTR